MPRGIRQNLRGDVGGARDLRWCASQHETRKELEISTPAKVQVNAQGDTLDFQRFTPSAAVKIVTFAAHWQNLDGWQQLHLICLSAERD